MKLKDRLKQYSNDLPWCDFSPDTLGSTIMTFLWQKEAFYRRWAQKWFENFQFVYGNHDVKWVRSFGFAVDIDFLQKKRYSTAKKSKTNISRLVAEALAAALYARQPKWDVSPASDSARQSKAIADMTEHLLDYISETGDCHNKFRIASNGFVTYGKIAAIVRFNKNAGIIKWVPKWRRIRKPVMTTTMKEDILLGGVIETPAQALDSQGQPLFEDSWEPVVTQTGQLAEVPEAQGALDIQILTPFEYRYEEGKSINDSKWVEWVRLIDYDDWLADYDKLAGKTKYFETVSPDMSTQRVHQYAIRQFFRMHFVSPDYDNRPIDMATSGAFLRNKVLVVEHYDKPNVELWPKGRRVVIANGVCTHITEPEYSTNTVGGWHPFCEAVWFNIPPSSMPAAAMNDVIQKNKELNVADSLILTAMHRNMGSVLLAKIGSGLDVDRFTGTPGDIHEVNDLDAAKYLHDEQPIPPAIPTIRQQIKDDVFEGSGAQDSIRGDKSKNVSAGYALRQLQEREEKRIAPARDIFEAFIAAIGTKAIACFRSNVETLGDDIMGYLKRSASGEFLAEEAVTFLTRNIEIGVDINVETGSMQVESKATKQFNLLDLVTKTAFGQKLASDPKIQDNFLREFGAEVLRGYSGAHIDRANGENEVFKDMLRLGPDRLGQAMPVCIFEDDDNIHIAEHQDFIIRNASDMTKNEAVMLQVLVHLETHRIQDKTKKGELPPDATLSVPTAEATARQKLSSPVQTQQQIQQSKLNPPSPQAQPAPAKPPPKEAPQPQQQGQPTVAQPANQGGSQNGQPA